MIKKFILYAFRWQLSTPILAPILIYCHGRFSTDPSVNLLAATFVANLVGSCIFFWVDGYIFRTKVTNPLWEVKEDTQCFVCGKQGRCYRLFKARHYDRTNDPQPEFLCEECSKKKAEQLRQRGIDIS